MDELLDVQSSLGEQIQTNYRNFKKDPAVRKSTRQYFATRLETLEAIWSEFQANHQQLLSQSKRDDNMYFTTDYYTTIGQLYNQFKEHLTQGLKTIDSDQRDTQPEAAKMSAFQSSSNDNLTNAGPSQSKDQEKAQQQFPPPTQGSGVIPTSKKPSSKILVQAPPSQTPSEGDHQDETIRMVRRQHRTMATLTRTLQEVADKANESLSQVYYELKIKMVNKVFDDITETDQRIWEETMEPPLDYTRELYDSLHDWVQETLVHLHERLKTRETVTVPADRQQVQSQIKLPRVTLPIFDGDYTKWTHFHDLFDQMIHSRQIGNAEKMFYLTSNLSGEARSLVKHLSISDANYAIAWNALNKRYNNQRLLCTALLNKLWDQPPTQSHSATSIKYLHDVTNECILALENIEVSTTNWDPMLVHLIIKKLDKTTHTLYEDSLDSPRALPTIKGLLSFLEKRFQTLESLGKEGHTSGREHGSKRTLQGQSRSSFVSTTKTRPCVVCKIKSHPLYFCPAFLAQSPSNRRNTLRHHKLCINCLKSDHPVAECKLRSCTKCSEKHNSLVHIDFTPKSHSSQRTASQGQASINSAKPATTNNINDQNSAVLTTHAKKSSRNYVILSTVAIEVSNGKGERLQCRAILDSGSQLNFITSELSRQLNLVQVPEAMYVQGIGKERQKTHHRVNLYIHSRVNNYSTRLEAFILNNIVSKQPDHIIKSELWPIPQNIPLADPDFNKPGTIDLLIGAEVYFDLIAVGQIKLGKKLPTLQNTMFGWTVSGPVHDEKASYALCGVCTEDERLENQLNKFWKLEEIDSMDEACSLTRTEQRCVDHFNQNVKRNYQGRFIIKLPFSQDPKTLGESKDIAIQRFYSLERRLGRHPDIKKQYVEFMREYEAAGHMKVTNLAEIKGPHYFLPHHHVTKLDSSTTKLRVVFDGSAKTSSNLSLNDVLCKGPTIQDELLSILLRFRFPRFVFTADIEKMYRQVEVAEEDQQYQLVAWREDPHQPLKYFKLCTVTYGLAPAPFLATKCLEYLANEGILTHPLGAQTLKRDFYVDDVMTGSDSLSELLETQSQLKLLLASGGFNLRKWCGNHPQLLRHIPKEDIELELNFNEPADEYVKTLGLTWQPGADIFRIKTTWTDTRKVTKRTALSDISHIFDPLGFMNPVTIIARIFIRKIWSLKLDWDASLPMDMHTSWLKFREELKLLNEIQIPRHIASSKKYKTIQLHAFADASETAYGAAIYVRTAHQDGVITVRLLCAKSKVAPIKTTTLPRLELCAAKLAAQLMHRVRRDINLPYHKVYFWTDSEITLAWINSESSSYHTFVANRVAAIQRLSNQEQWRHVRSKDNPADIVSRGLAPAKLIKCNLWFYGPQFLHGSEAIWPPQPPKREVNVERKSQRPVALALSTESPWIASINHRNSFQKLLRIVAYMLRFIRGSRQQGRPSSVELSATELDNALMIVISEMQREGFKDELHQLQKDKCVNINSPLNSLCPFLDDRKIIRVGGRLENSELSYDAKHPILVPYSHPLTTLLMTDIHIRNLHVGPQGLLAITRQRYWPVKGKNTARSIVQHCVRCNKVRPKLMTQLMGNLPSTRVQPARPFVNAGVDFCGPIQTHFKLRGKRPQKSYIAVFCCFTTKAIHLEVASDLTTEGFIGVLKRFVARRGNCRNLYCDNATNFVGAKTQLLELQQSIYAPNSTQKISEFCRARGTDFHFIPPRAPHFGGLWEAAVKSAKSLLQRSVASAALTFEELSTVTAEIEAILNSRPLTPLSDDPNDLAALTPGHFLIGEPTTAVVDPEAAPKQISLVKRWKLVSHIKHEFWRRWSTEYLCVLQQRHKWKQQSKNAKPGMMVLIKEDNLPPLKWQLGRIEKTIQGEDGLVRVADVRTTSGIRRRPIHKLAPLPVEEKEEHNSSGTTNQPNTSRSNHTPAQATSSETPPKAKKFRPSASSAISMFLLTCFILPILGNPSAHVTPFSSQPGIYFENLGAANLVSNEWSLIVYYDMAGYWKEAAAINTTISKLHTLCNLLKDESHSYCSVITNQFASLREELAQSNELLQASPKRAKRAPLNIVGNIASALFGVLDSEYAEKLSTTIDHIRTNENHLLELIKNQTSVIDSTLNVLKHDQETTAHQLDTIKTHVWIMSNQVNNISEEFYQQKLAETFSTWAMQVTLMTMKYQRAQAAILDVLTDTHHGKVNPQLLSPRQLKEELNMIKDHLPSTLRLPTKQNNLLQLYNLMKIEGRATAKYVIFRIRLPLFTFEEFELYRIIPVPVIVNGSFMAVKPSAEFLVINLHKDKYYPLTSQEFHLCETIGESEHMCIQKHPIYRRGANVSSCELSFMTYAQPSNNCEVVNAEELPKWIQLYNPNKWIYSVKRKTSITIVCGTNTVQQVLQGAGILSIATSCEIRHDYLTLQAHNTYPKTMKSSFNPTQNITDLIYPQGSASSVKLPRPIEHHHHHEQIENIQKQIQELRKNEILPQQIDMNNTHQLTLGYTALLIAITIGSVLLYIKCTKRGNKSTHRTPVPAPRTSGIRQFNIDPELIIQEVCPEAGQGGGGC